MLTKEFSGTIGSKNTVWFDIKFVCCFTSQCCNCVDTYLLQTQARLHYSVFEDGRETQEEI